MEPWVSSLGLCKWFQFANPQSHRLLHRTTSSKVTPKAATISSSKISGASFIWPSSSNKFQLISIERSLYSIFFFFLFFVLVNYSIFFLRHDKSVRYIKCLKATEVASRLYYTLLRRKIHDYAIKLIKLESSTYSTLVHE